MSQVRSISLKSIPPFRLEPRLALGAGYIVLVTGGVVILVTQLYSLPAEQYSYFITDLDAAASGKYWHTFPAEAQIIDRVPERSVALFGRITRSSAGIYEPLPDWEAAIADPDPLLLTRAGYGWIYFDKIWWNSLAKEQQLRFEQPCVDVLDEWRSADGLDYRVLMDLRACAAP